MALEIPVSLSGAGPSSSISITVRHTYGAQEPVVPSNPCPWDCADGNGVIDTVDFVALLSEWGQTGTACDFDDNGVDTVDFLALLAAWGPCP
jgi:hypothetical protein